MNIKPIKNEMDYNDALRRVEELWGAAIGSKEGDELDVLTTLIEAYERQHYSIDRPSPIDAIKKRKLWLKARVKLSDCSESYEPSVRSELSLA